MSRIPLEQFLATEAQRHRDGKRGGQGDKETRRGEDKVISLHLFLSAVSPWLCGYLRAPLEQITSFDQGAHLAVGDAPVEHPEAAVRVNIFEPALACLPDNRFDAGGDELRAFDFVVLDVYDSDAEADVRIEVAKHFQLVVAPPRKLEHKMIGAQFVQKRDQVAPESPLDGLPAVIAEADVYGG